MPDIADKPQCLICNEQFTDAGMTRHIKSCLEKNDQARQPEHGEPVDFFHVQVLTPDRPEYWLHLKVHSQARLEDLDRFLREVWLECCDQESVFSFSTTNKREILDKKSKLADVFLPGLIVDYEYGTDTVTELNVRVHDIHTGPMAEGRPVEILARNLMPAHPCDDCGQEAAVKVCQGCHDDGYLCRECAEKHDCESAMLADLANSPQTGECAYGEGAV